VQPLPFCLLSVFPAFFAAFAATFLLMTGLLFSSIIADIRKTRTTQASFLLVLLQITLRVSATEEEMVQQRKTLLDEL
jgi:DMSO/TMAO reductase YedYZ heme-binding membrane subunit